MKSFNEWLNEQYIGRTIKDVANRQASSIILAYDSLVNIFNLIRSSSAFDQPIKQIHRNKVIELLKNVLEEMKKVDNISTGANAATGGSLSVKNLLNKDGSNNEIEKLGRTFHYYHNYFVEIYKKFQDQSLTPLQAQRIINDSKNELESIYLNIKKQKESGVINSWADELDPPARFAS